MSKNYHFTQDWFSGNIPTLKRYLAPYVDKPTFILEIGCYEGRSTIWFLENILKHQDSIIVCVDNFLCDIQDTKEQKESIEEKFSTNILSSDFAHKVHVYNCDSLNFFTLNEKIIKEYDMIYIKGDHTSTTTVFKDAIASFPLLKKDGLLIFKNYRCCDDMSNYQQPYLGITLFLELYKQDLHVEYRSCYLFIVRKIADSNPYKINISKI